MAKRKKDKKAKKPVDKKKVENVEKKPIEKFELKWTIDDIPIDKIVIPEKRITTYYPEAFRELLNQTIKIGEVYVDFIKVVKIGDKYVLADGFNRLQAYKQANEKTVPAVIYEGDEKLVHILNILYNPITNRDVYQLKDVIYHLKEKFGMSYKEIAKLLNLSEKYIQRLYKDYCQELLFEEIKKILEQNNNRMKKSELIEKYGEDIVTKFIIHSDYAVITENNEEWIVTRDIAEAYKKSKPKEQVRVISEEEFEERVKKAREQKLEEALEKARERIEELKQEIEPKVEPEEKTIKQMIEEKQMQEIQCELCGSKMIFKDSKPYAGIQLCKNCYDFVTDINRRVIKFIKAIAPISIDTKQKIYELLDKFTDELVKLKEEKKEEKKEEEQIEISEDEIIDQIYSLLEESAKHYDTVIEIITNRMSSVSKEQVKAILDRLISDGFLEKDKEGIVKISEKKVNWYD